LKLSIKVPPYYTKERAYIIDVLFGVFLGLDYLIEIEDRSNTSISLDGINCITLPDILFQCPEEKWLSLDSLPKQPLNVWDTRSLGFNCCLTSHHIPVIYGYQDTALPAFSKKQRLGSIDLPIDIIGSAFFMITRYEEIVKSDRDREGHFPVHASLAFQEGFLERPIINEYLEILWACLQYVSPGLERSIRQGRTFLTHDVDSPLSSMQMNWRQIFRSCVGDMVKRESIGLAEKRMKAKVDFQKGYYDNDPHNTYDFIMDISERHNVVSLFNFIFAEVTDSGTTSYNAEHPFIINLIKKIKQRGHEIGWHAGLQTFNNPTNAKNEYNRFVSLCAKLGIDQKKTGGRQHHLCWENPVTWRIWDELGLDYDSTVYFAEIPGFRCGVCYEYPVFDLISRRRLVLTERPLILMDTSLFAYQKVDLAEAYDITVKINDVCKKFRGEFIGLWHNSKIIAPRVKEWYVNVIEAIC